MDNNDMNKKYEKVQLSENVQKMDLSLKKHYLNSLAEHVVGDYMGLPLSEDAELWKYGDPGVDFEKDGLKFDVIYNPDPSGGLYLTMDKPHVADVYLLVTGNDKMMYVIGWAYREDFNNNSIMVIKNDGDKEMLTISQDNLRKLNTFKWFID